jgi:GTP-binding protein
VIRIADATFVTTATRKDQYPREKLPEVAFVGRSNVGKSSMINTLAGRRKLVRVSNTPGRTRTLNFFDVKVDSRGRVRKVRLCDLPGYGYAKASKVERDEWQTMIEEYLTEREQLGVVVSIIDVEVGPTPDDLQMIDFLQQTEARILVVATRLDRLPKAKRKPRLDELCRTLELPHGTVVGFSSVDRLGFEEVWGRLLDITG